MAACIQASLQGMDPVVQCSQGSSLNYSTRTTTAICHELNSRSWLMLLRSLTTLARSCRLMLAPVREKDRKELTGVLNYYDAMDLR